MDELLILEPDADQRSIGCPPTCRGPCDLAGRRQEQSHMARQDFADLCRLPEPLGSLFQTRLAETRLRADTQDLLATYRDSLSVVAFVTPEDPDTIAVLPILARMVAAARA